MSFSLQRSQFYVYVVSASLERSEELRREFGSVGYNVHCFPTMGSVFVALEQSPPHIVVLDAVSMPKDAIGFLEEVKERSEEILVIPIVPESLSWQALQWVGQDLAYDFIAQPYASSLELIQKLDRGAQGLFYKFQQVESTLQPRPIQDTREWLSLEKAMQSLVRAQDQVDLTQKCLDEVSAVAHGAPVVYFRRLSRPASYVLSQACRLDVQKTRAVHLQLPSDLAITMKNSFGLDAYSSWEHKDNNLIEGIIVLFGQILSESVRIRIEAILAFHHINSERLRLLKERHTQELINPQTRFYTARALHDKLAEEVARSRRCSQPVSLILLHMDEENIRKNAKIIKETSRLNDLIIHVRKDQLALVMPHTDRQGAILRAERLRRAFEGRIAIGLSEYPAMALDSEQLFRSADEALRQAIQKSGERICLPATL